MGRVKKTGPTPQTREAVFARDGLLCALCGEVCGARLAIHHRLPRGRGGDNRLSNLLLLGDVGGCHDTVVESYREAAYNSGWLVRTGQNPADVPVVRFGEWSLLGDDGTVKTCPQPGADDCTDQTPCDRCPKAAP